jgi:hypothetical protein
MSLGLSPWAKMTARELINCINRVEKCFAWETRPIILHSRHIVTEV